MVENKLNNLYLVQIYNSQILITLHELVVFHVIAKSGNYCRDKKPIFYIADKVLYYDVPSLIRGRGRLAVMFNNP